MLRVCVRTHVRVDGVCLRQTLCGCGECEKLGVLTALEQFQYSVGAGGVWGCGIFRRVEGVRIRSADEWKGFIPTFEISILRK